MDVVSNTADDCVRLKYMCGDPFVCPTGSSIAICSLGIPVVKLEHISLAVLLLIISQLLLRGHDLVCNMCCFSEAYLKMVRNVISRKQYLQHTFSLACW